MSEYRYLIQENIPKRCTSDILICDTEKEAWDYLQKFDHKGYLSYKRIPKLTGDLDKIFVKNIISTVDGKTVYSIRSEHFETDKYDLKDDNVNKFKILDESYVIDNDILTIVVIANRIIVRREAVDIIARYKDEYDMEIPKFEFKIGDEVEDDAGNKGYIISIANHIDWLADAVDVMTSKKEIKKSVYCKDIKRTGRFSTQIAKMFSEDSEIEVDE